VFMIEWQVRPESLCLSWYHSSCTLHGAVQQKHHRGYKVDTTNHEHRLVGINLSRSFILLSLAKPWHSVFTM
jgi:hypothetical protein